MLCCGWRAGWERPAAGWFGRRLLEAISVDELAVIDARGGHWLDKADEMKPKSKQSLTWTAAAAQKQLTKKALDECVDGGFIQSHLQLVAIDEWQMYDGCTTTLTRCFEPDLGGFRKGH